MALRRILYQIGILAGLATFAVTLWQAMARWELDFLTASIRAVEAAIAVIVLALIVAVVIVGLGGPDRQ